MHWLSRKNYDFVLAMGAGWTDEMLFQTIPEHAWTVRVGMLKTDAKYVIKSQEDALNLLKNLEKH